MLTVHYEIDLKFRGDFYPLTYTEGGNCQFDSEAEAREEIATDPELTPAECRVVRVTREIVAP